MPRREILSPAQREALLVVPVDRAGLIEHYVLSEQDISLIRQRRGDHNRLGIAVQLALLRFPGTALQADETPPKELINFLARQLHVPSSAWDEYAQRDETRREHLLELQTRYEFRSFTFSHYRSLARWLLSTALQTNRRIALVRAAIEELHRRSVIVPRLPVLERLCAETALRAQRHLFATLSANLTDKQRRQLDALLEPHEDRQISVLAWLRLPSGVPTPRNILIHIERLQRIRAIELPPDLGQRIHQNRLLQLAREGAATTIQHLARFDDERRYGSLLAVLLETTATLTDEILDLHDRFIGGLFSKAKRKHDEAFQASGRAINEKVRLYAQIGQVLLAAKRDGADPLAAIEEILSWEDFTRSVSEAERLARPEDFDFLGLITDGYCQLRRYAPTRLETFDFRAAPVVTPLMDAIETLRVVNRDKVRTIPGSANTDFVSRRWRPYVFMEQGIDRRFYELCVLSELKNRLHSGDVWVVGSRQFKDFDTYLLDSKLFAELRDQDRLSLMWLRTITAI
jgi:TnpA family transposase